MDSAILFIIIFLIPCFVYLLYSIFTNRYHQIAIKKKFSGFDVARKLLDENNLDNMYIVEYRGKLNDHYDTKQMVVRLSTDTYNNESLAAVLTAARVSVYAIMSKENNSYIKFRDLLNPLIDFIVYIAFIVFIVSLLVQDNSMLTIASVLLVITLLFHIFTLPIEYMVMKRLKSELKKHKIVNDNEINRGSCFLYISSLTYVMSIFTNFVDLVWNFLDNIRSK